MPIFQMFLESASYPGWNFSLIPKECHSKSPQCSHEVTNYGLHQTNSLSAEEAVKNRGAMLQLGEKQQLVQFATKLQLCLQLRSEMCQMLFRSQLRHRTRIFHSLEGATHLFRPLCRTFGAPVIFLILPIVCHFVTTLWAFRITFLRNQQKINPNYLKKHCHLCNQL